MRNKKLTFFIKAYTFKISLNLNFCDGVFGGEGRLLALWVCGQSNLQTQSDTILGERERFLTIILFFFFSRFDSAAGANDTILDLPTDYIHQRAVFPACSPSCSHQEDRVLLLGRVSSAVAGPGRVTERGGGGGVGGGGVTCSCTWSGLGAAGAGWPSA